MKHLDSTQKKLLIPLSALVLLGVAGGFVRYLHLTKAFDALGLAIRGNPYGTVLTVLSVIVLLGLAAVYAAARFGKKTVFDGAAIGSAPKAALFPAALGTVAAMLAAIKALVDSVGSFSAWGMLNGLLLLASAVLTLPVLRKLAAPDIDSPLCSASLVIVFWASFRLIEIYRNVSANPATGAYLCDVMAMIALILMFFACSGYLLGKVSARRVYWMTAAYFFFGTVAMIGRGLVCAHAVLTPAVLSLTDLFDVFVYFYGFACACSIALGFFFPAAKPEPTDEP